MKKGKRSLSIGTKVYSMLAILIISFMVYNLLANLGLNEAKRSIENLSQTYLKIQQHNEVVSKNVAEIRLYSNLIIMLPDQNSATQMAQMVPGFVETIDVSLNEMHSLAESIDNQKLMDALVIYEEKTHVLEENITTTAEIFVAGDRAGAAASHGQMRVIVT